MSACALAAAGVMLLAADAPPPPLVVVVQGDGLAAGRAQADIERELRAKGVVVRSATDLVADIGAPAEALPSAPRAVEAAQARCSDAEAAFLRGELGAARASAEAALKALARVPVEVGFDERVRATLWRAAALRQGGNVAAATSVIRGLLHELDPAPRVSTDVFPPDFVGFVEAERIAVKTRPVKLDGLPASAQIWVNGRPVESNPFPVAIRRGNSPNRIVVRAPGYRTIQYELPVTPPSEISMPMALALPSEREAELSAALAKDGDDAMLEALAKRTEAAGVVVAQVRGRDLRGWFHRSGHSTGELSSRSASGIAAEVVAIFRPAPISQTVLTSAGMEVSFWQRRFGDLYTIPLSGTGPRLTVDVDWRNVLAAAEVSYVSYAFTPIEARIEPGSTGVPGGTQKGEGGTAVRASAAVGYGLEIQDRLSLGALVGARVEQYSMKTMRVEVAPGRFEPLVGSHSWSGAEVRVRGVYATSPIRVSLAAGMVLGGRYRERPAKTSGSDPTAAPAPFWQLGGTYSRSDALTFGLSYYGEARTIAFEGTPRVDRETSNDSDPVLSDFMTVFSLTAAYSF